MAGFLGFKVEQTKKTKQLWMQKFNTKNKAYIQEEQV